MSPSLPPKPRSLFGFFGVSTLIGMAFGFVPYEMHAGAEGHIWGSHGYMNSTIVATVVGGLIGFMCGWFLDATLETPQKRRKTVRWLWGLYLFSLLMYLLLLRPAIYAVR